MSVIIVKHKEVMKPYKRRTQPLDADLSPTVQIALGANYLPYLTLVRIDEVYYFCTHEKRALPEPRMLVGKVKGDLHNGDCSFDAINLEQYLVTLEAIQQHEKYGGFHINPHTFIVTWCLSQGVDLYGLGLLNL